MSEPTRRAIRVLRELVSAGSIGSRLMPRDMRALVEHIDALERQVESIGCASCRAAADAAAERAGASTSAPETDTHV